MSYIKFNYDSQGPLTHEKVGEFSLDNLYDIYETVEALISIRLDEDYQKEIAGDYQDSERDCTP